MPTEQHDAPFAFSGLSRVFHERARLGIVTSLAGQREGLAFAQLKRLCGLTDGNLNRHLMVLEEAGYVSINKDLSDRRPRTVCHLTAIGREHFVTYLGELELALREGAQAATRNVEWRLRPVLSD